MKHIGAHSVQALLLKSIFSLIDDQTIIDGHKVQEDLTSIIILRKSLQYVLIQAPSHKLINSKRMKEQGEICKDLRFTIFNFEPPPP